MNFVAQASSGTLNLQSALSASSATGPWDTFIVPHHPITCSSDLRAAFSRRMTESEEAKYRSRTKR